MGTNMLEQLSEACVQAAPQSCSRQLAKTSTYIREDATGQVNKVQVSFWETSPGGDSEWFDKGPSQDRRTDNLL